MNIQQTEDYGKFLTLAGNRDVNEVKVRHLVESIAKKNLLHLNPIQVNERFEVIDGQHRLEAARRSGVAIYFIVANGLSIDDAILENSNHSGWQGKDYLKSWVDRGNEHYRVLQLFAEQYGLPTITSLGLLTGSNLKQEGGTGANRFAGTNSRMRVFKEGRLTLHGYEVKKAEAFADKLMLFKPYTDANCWRTPAFIKALQVTLTKASHTRLLAKIKTHGFGIKKVVTVKDYLRQFEDILNFAAREGHRVRLYE